MDLSAGAVAHKFIELIPLHGHAELQSMNPAGEKHIVITLKGIPPEKRHALCVQTSDVFVDTTHQESAQVVPRDRSQGGISRRRIDGLQCLGSIGEISIESKSQRVDERGVEDMTLFDNQGLTLCQRT